MLKYAIFVFAFYACASWSMDRLEDSLTTRDQYLLEMRHQMAMMDQCKDNNVTTQKFGGSCAHSKIEWGEKQARLTELMDLFEKATHCGLNGLGTWKLYNACFDQGRDDFHAPTHSLPNPASVEKTSLMSLVQNLIRVTAAQDDRDFKLEELARGDEDATKRLRDLLIGSFTLHVPMSRALKKSLAEQRSFAACLEEQLSLGYWRDSSFSAAMVEFKDYLFYEHQKSKRNPSLVAEYPGLENDSADGLALQYMANFLILNVVQPFLTSEKKYGVAEEKISMRESKAFAAAENVGMVYSNNYSGHYQDFKTLSPVWFSIVNHILYGTKNRAIQITAERRGTLSNFHLYDNVEKTVLMLNQTFDGFRMSEKVPKRLIGLIEEYEAAVRANPAIIAPSSDLGAKIVHEIVTTKFTSREEYAQLNLRFYNLQEAIRAADYWHTGRHDRIFSTKYTENIEDYIKKYNNAGWEDKVLILKDLANIVDIRTGDHDLKNTVKQMAVDLSRYVQYLYEKDVIDVLEIVVKFELADQVDHVSRFLSKLEAISENPRAIKALKESNVQKMAKSGGETPTRIAASRKKRSSSARQLSLKYSADGQSKHEKINYPIDKGLGEIAEHLMTSTIFKGASRDLLLMVARLVETRRFTAGELIFKQDDSADSFALIVDGRLSIFVKDGREKREVGRKIKGDAVGDVSLFKDNAKRIATVRAAEYTILYTISNSKFKKIMINEPEIMKLMFASLVKTVADQHKRLLDLGLIVTTEEKCLLDGIAPLNIAALARKSEEKTIKRGNFDLSDGNKVLYKIQEGQLYIGDKDEGEVCVKAGRYLNELAFFAKDKGVKISGRSSGACTLYCLSRKDFDAEASKNTDMMWVMAGGLTDKLQKYNELLKRPFAYELQLACERNDLEMFKSALASSKNVDVDAQCPTTTPIGRNVYPLHVAAALGNLEIVNALIAARANMKIKDRNGDTALHHAAREGHPEVVQILMSINGLAHKKNNKRKTAYDVAKDPRVKELLRGMLVVSDDSISATSSSGCLLPR